MITTLRRFLCGDAACALCRGWAGDSAPLCRPCLADLPWRGWEPAGAGHRLETGERIPVYAAFAYRYPLDRIIAKVKAGGSPALAAHLVGLAAARLPASLDALGAARPCAVPTLPRRAARRRIDLPLALAGSIASALGSAPSRLRPPSGGGSRVAQHGRNAAARRSLVGTAPRPVEGLRGARLLLIDDVCTTGSTLAQWAKGLEAHGALVIGALVLALADPPRSPAVQTSRFTTDRA